MLTREMIDNITLEMLQSNHVPVATAPGIFPVRDSFIGYISPYWGAIIDNMNGFIPKDWYPSPGELRESMIPKEEFGSIGNLRIHFSEKIERDEIIVESENGKKKFEIKA